MVNKKINNILTRVTDNLKDDLKVICEEFGHVDYVNDNKQTLLHIFLSKKYDERSVFLIIKSLIKYGKLDVNSKDADGNTFIQTALWTGYSENFVIELINLALTCDKKLDVNTCDNDGNTIIHTAIKSSMYNDGIACIYSLLSNNNFNYTVKDNDGKDIMTLIEEYHGNNLKFDNEQLATLRKIIISGETLNNEENNDIISQEDANKISKLGKILNNKKYLFEPSIGRNKEIEALIISLASEQTSALLVGEQGVGKTTLLNELVYKIQNNDVPNFLKNKLVIEVNPTELIAGAKYSGTFEERIKTLMEICSKYNAILVVDKITRIFGTGTHDKSKIDMALMLVPYLENENIKLIGTSNYEEYNEYINDSELKDKFDTIKVEEPDYDTLYKIIEKTFNDYSIKTNIAVDDILNNNFIIDSLIKLTSRNHRVYTNNISNPRLVISIIDKSFAYAKVENVTRLTKEHLIKSLGLCNNIYQVAREDLIRKFNSSEINNKPKTKVLKIDFRNKNQDTLNK